MENTELLSKYELMVIIDSKLTDGEKESIRKEATEIVKKGGGRVINSQVWLEKRKFTFEIKKKTEGLYYSINFESPSSAIEKMQADLKLKERILRSLVIKIE